MIAVGRLAPVNQWDQAMLDDLFANTLYPTGLTFSRHEGYPGYPNSEGCVLLIPGRYWHKHTDQISQAIQRYSWVLGIRTGDEEDEFDIGAVTHPNLKWWVQTPKVGKAYGDARFIGVGYTPHFRCLSEDVPDKDIDVFLSAQSTHTRRRECFTALEKTAGSQFVHATDGFTQSWREGASPGDYAVQMMKAKVAPAPSGAVSPDSFRLWEALEAHTVPIADDISPTYDSAGFWDMVLPGAPFPALRDYNDLPGYVGDALDAWPTNANRITAWWMRQKRRYSQWLVDDLTALGAL